ncbi:MAG: UpxY family transcription antiterminator [Bacteroidales bacterium]|nr:UpxY family transcription antiterminator [Bacteroidales bacterium]MCF8455753.1 UpxY family transcription antiterminator [Bacteroidales bacterium]
MEKPTFDKRWHVVYSAPKAEMKVDQEFQELGLETFCPTQTVVRQWSDRKKKVEKVLFTSYVFVKCNFRDYENIYRVQGFVRFVYYLGKPAIVRDHEIENIKIFLEQVTDHSITFVRDEMVRIAEGPLEGRTGTVENIGKNKIRIRIGQLGMSLVAEVHKNKVKHLQTAV